MPNTNNRNSTSEVIEDYLPIVRYWARHYSHRGHQVLEFEDLVIVGLIGLMDALKRYRPERNTHFKTYAEFRIRGQIVDELRCLDWMTRSERRKHKTYQSVENKLGHALGRSPTRLELANNLSLESQDLDRMALYGQKESLRPYLEGDLEESSKGLDLVAETVERHDEVNELLGELSTPMRKVMEMRYFEDSSIEEIAKVVGLSLGRVSQLHNEAIGLMRKSTKVAA